MPQIAFESGDSREDSGLSERGLRTAQSLLFFDGLCNLSWAKIRMPKNKLHCEPLFKAVRTRGNLWSTLIANRGEKSGSLEVKQKIKRTGSRRLLINLRGFLVTVRLGCPSPPTSKIQFVPFPSILFFFCTAVRGGGRFKGRYPRREAAELYNSNGWMELPMDKTWL